MEKHIKAAKYIAYLLDNRFSIFGFRFGLDPLLGLIPGAGDVISALLSSYIVWIAWKHKFPQHKINQMIANIVLDFVLGTIPVVGDVADFFYKSNTRNLKILLEFSELQQA